MTSATWLDARTWRLRATQIRALAEEMKEAEPKAIMLRIAVDYDRLAQWHEKNALPIFPTPTTGNLLSKDVFDLMRMH